MKTFLILLLSAFTTIAGGMNFREYFPAAMKIEKRYLKIQSDFAKMNIRYRYNFSPITLFPCFCLDSDTLSKFLAKPLILYVDDVTTIGIYSQRGRRHVLLAVKSYISSKYGTEAITYTLFLMRHNFETKDWEEIQTPIRVTLVRTNRERNEYGCRD